MFTLEAGELFFSPEQVEVRTEGRRLAGAAR
jgi:hypothetical protein